MSCHKLLLLFLLWSFSHIVAPHPSLNFIERFSSLFCLVIVLQLHMRFFKWTLNMPKYECWEYVITPQIFTFRLQSKYECQFILLHLMNLTYSVSHQYSLTPWLPITLILSLFLFYFILFYGSVVLTHSCTHFGYLPQNNPLVPSFSICPLIFGNHAEGMAPSQLVLLCL